MTPRQLALIEKLTNEAAINGFEYVGKAPVTAYHIYRCSCCENEGWYHPSAMRSKGGVACRGCVVDKHEAEANAHGYTLVGTGRKNTYRTYKCLTCNTEKEVEIQCMRRGAVVCAHCEESSWAKESYFYVHIIRHEDKQWVKIGVAQDVAYRIKGYKLAGGATVDTIHATLCKDRFESIGNFESPLKKILTDYQLDKKEMKEVMGCGFTECYHLDSLPTIMQYLGSVLGK